MPTAEPLFPRLPDALECTLYRPDPAAADDEPEDLGDGSVHFDGPFEPPLDWDQAEREGFFGEHASDAFGVARIAVPGATPQPGDLLAVSLPSGEVEMYFVEMPHDAGDATAFVLLRDEPLD